jgi:hypothetical protein
MMVDETKEVSATDVVYNDGTIVAVVDENRRPFTSASSIDDIAYTVECANETLAPGYTISAAAVESLVRLCVLWSEQMGLLPTRDVIIGHREIYTRFGLSYATACPGGMPLDAISAEAMRRRTGVLPASAKPEVIIPLDQEEDDDMTLQFYVQNQTNNDAIAKKQTSLNQAAGDGHALQISGSFEMIAVVGPEGVRLVDPGNRALWERTKAINNTRRNAILARKALKDGDPAQLPADYPVPFELTDRDLLSIDANALQTMLMVYGGGDGRNFWDW